MSSHYFLTPEDSHLAHHKCLPNDLSSADRGIICFHKRPLLIDYAHTANFGMQGNVCDVHIWERKVHYT
jgi:hypothetical protein